MKNIEKIFKFIKESGNEHFPSIRFRSKCLDCSKEDIQISCFSYGDEVSLFWGTTCLTMAENDIAKVEAWKLPHRNYKFLIITFNDGGRLLLERHLNSGNPVDLSKLSEEDWQEIERRATDIGGEKEHFIEQLLNER